MPASTFIFNGFHMVGGFYRVYLSLKVEGREGLYLPFETQYTGGSYQTI